MSTRRPPPGHDGRGQRPLASEYTQSSVCLPFSLVAGASLPAIHGRKQLWTRFEAPPLAHLVADSYRLRISGVPPTAVYWVLLHYQDHVLFEMASRCDDQGRVSTAGELIEAMALMDGLAGMLINCTRSRLPAHDQQPLLDMKLRLPCANDAGLLRVSAETY